VVLRRLNRAYSGPWPTEVEVGIDVPPRGTEPGQHRRRRGLRREIPTEWPIAYYSPSGGAREAPFPSGHIQPNAVGYRIWQRADGPDRSAARVAGTDGRFARGSWNQSAATAVPASRVK